MAPDIDALPAEMVESLVGLLELEDICHLRLAGKSLSAKASQGHFKDFFVARKLHVDNVQHIERFIADVPRSSIIASVRRLTISGKASCSDLDTDRLGELLFQLFTTLQNARSRRGLLSLRMSVDQDPEVDLHAPGANFATWKRNTTAATRIFKVTMQAVQEAQLQLQGLHVLDDVICCSLPCDELMDGLDLERLSACLRPTTSLSLNISHHRNTAIEEDDGTSKYRSADDPRESSESGKQRKNAISGFLKMMPKLTELDLQWYTLRRRKATASDHEVATWNNAIHEILPKTLKSIALRGFEVSSDTLLRLLSAPSVEKVSLRKVSLHTGKWSSVLDVLTGIQSNVRNLYLEDLFEDNRKLIYFAVEGTPNFPSKGGNAGPNRLEWSKGDEHVEYSILKRRALGSGKHRNWLLGQAQQVGPPDLIP
jgi:hypothetical protein